MDGHRHVRSQKQLAEICRQALVNWPEAKAAVLFGSRARSPLPSDNRRESDWDVAVIVDGNQPAEWADPVRKKADNIDAWAIGCDYLESHAGDLGRLPCAVTLDGRLLAGHWIRPKPKVAISRPEDWQERMLSTTNKITGAINNLMEVARKKSWPDAYGHCVGFLEHSADAAELLVKAVMERRGIRADHIHSIEGLTQTFAKKRPDEQDLAQRMKALNGYNHKDHMAMYGGGMIDLDRFRNAIVRLTGALDLWLDELVANPDSNAMKQVIPYLFSVALDDLDVWKDALDQEPAPKTGTDDHRRKAVEAVLAARGEITQSVIAFGNRLHQLTPQSEPGHPNS